MNAQQTIVGEGLPEPSGGLYPRFVRIEHDIAAIYRAKANEGLKNYIAWCRQARVEPQDFVPFLGDTRPYQ